jgi:hypothetical protein
MTPPYFCDYLAFEEELALYLNNSESHLRKDDLYQDWGIEIGQLVVEKIFFFQYKHM